MFITPYINNTTIGDIIYYGTIKYVQTNKNKQEIG